MPRTTTDLHAVARHFRRADPIIAEVIGRVGPFGLKRQRNRFAMLVRSILSQQISTSAARSIRLRLEQKVGPEGISPSTIARLTPEDLRSVGLSARKIEYVQDLAQKSLAGTLRLQRIGRLDDETIIEQLTQVRGIGRWTAQMFLIFSLGRLDVFPHDDLGIRSAIQHLYGLEELPLTAACLKIGERWTPYASIASWYCWRALELRRAELRNADARPVEGRPVEPGKAEPRKRKNENGKPRILSRDDVKKRST
jgi:DNA-3-methyladenine glycosylase II